MKKAQRFSEQLRAAVLSADESRYKISKATGIPEGNLSRFVHGRAWLSVESLDKLCAHLGLQLVGPQTRKK